MAAIVYVRAGGSGTGTSWSTAFTSLATALADAGTTAGATVYVDSAFAETPAGTQTFSNNGTNLLPIKIVSATYPGSDIAPTTYTPGASVTPTTAGNDLIFTGHAVSYGVNYVSREHIDSGIDDTWEFHDCTLKTLSTATNDFFSFDNYDSIYSFFNVTFEFGNAAQGFQLGGGGGFYAKNCTTAGTGLNGLVLGVATRAGPIEFDDCDFSNMANNGTIFDAVPSAGAGQPVYMRASNCILAATGGTVSDKTLVTKDSFIEGFNCSASTTGENSYYFQSLFGTANNDTDVYLDLTNGFSLKLDSSDDAVEVYHPFRVLLGEVHCAADAIITVEGLVDTNTDALPQDDEFWLDIVYPKVTTVQTREFATTLRGHDDHWKNDGATTSPNFLAASPSTLTTSSAWTSTTDITTPGPFKATIDLGVDPTTKSGAGIVQVWVNWARPSVTCYVDSKIVVT